MMPFIPEVYEERSSIPLKQLDNNRIDDQFVGDQSNDGSYLSTAGTRYTQP
jgi:hypothetical protein